MRNIHSRAMRVTLLAVLAAFPFPPVGIQAVRAELVLHLNPYEGVAWDAVEQHKANLHTHTTQSDGSMSPATVIDEYHGRGYSVLALTDHNLATYPWQNYGRDPGQLGMVAIAGNELSRHHHTLSLFSDLTTPTSDWETAIHQVGEAGGLAVICHPAMHWRSWSIASGGSEEEGSVPDAVVERYAQLYRTYPHLVGTEVSNGTRPLNEYPLDRELWDDLLMKLMPERPVWGFAVDDMHGMTHLGRDWISVVTGELSEQAVRDAITGGTFFASTIRLHPSGNQSVGATPIVHRVDHDAAHGVITLSATHAGAPLPDDAYQWIADGEVVHVGPSLDYQNTPGINNYVRAEITGAGGTTFTNPFGFTSPGESVINGLVGYWNFHDDVTGNQVGGADALVLTGAPVSGVMEGGSGFVGGALVLDGSSGIQVPIGTADLGSSFAVGAWYWQAPNPADRSSVFEASDNYDVSFGTSAPGNTFVSYVGEVAAGTVETGYEQWHHVLHSFDTAWNETHQRFDTTLSVYVDGVLRGTPTTVPTDDVDFTAINVGTYRGADGRFFDGMIDDVTLWNRALHASEVMVIHEMGRAGDALLPVLRVKADNLENLNAGASWEGGHAPADSDYIVFDAGFSRTEPLNTGGPLAVKGIRVMDGTSPVYVGDTSPNHHLAVGNKGIDMAAAERDLTVENLRLSTDQVWNVRGGRTLAVSGLSGDGSVTKRGDGTVVLSGAADDFTGDTLVSGGTLLVAANGALGEGALTLAGAALHVQQGATLSNDIVLDAEAERNFIRATIGMAVDYLIVGGGGGGGGRDSSGGGGGGGVVSNLITPGSPAALWLVAGRNEVVVGAGGAGGVNTTLGGNGQASSLGSITALGGGAGGPYASPAADGASGGGAGRQSSPGKGTQGQGFDGGMGTGGGNSAVDAGGGGGGAGGKGGDGVSASKGGDGGNGRAVDITGSAVYYGGGGGGAPHRLATALLGGGGGLGGGGDAASGSSVPPGHGAENTGGGGGASRSAPGYQGATPDLYTGGDGGSGIVIVRYPGEPAATGGTITTGTGTAAGYTIHAFTEVGKHALEFDPFDVTISGKMSGTGGFTWDTLGVLTLSAANTHTGHTRVVSGTLALANAQALRNSTLKLEGGTVDFAAPDTTSYGFGGLAGTGTVDAGENTLIIGENGENTVYSGELNAAALTKVGGGTLTLSGSNMLGGTTVSGGALVAASENALGDGPITLAGGTLYAGSGLTNEIILEGHATDNFLRGAVTMDYLVVGGGGGGGGRDVSGGGGGGGVLTNLADAGISPLVAIGGNVFDVTVGAGGAGGGASLSGGSYGTGATGQASSFADLTAPGGGGGGAYNAHGRDGASGGGGGRQGPLGGSGMPGLGFDGGSGTGGGDPAVDTGGGGGGAGGPGEDGVANAKGGDGGIGFAVDIAGESVYYGGGGGGTPHRNAPAAMLGGAGGLGGGGDGQHVAHQPANPGQTNTGGGGGASRSDNEAIGIGGAGGSGIVVVRYPGAPVAVGGTITQGTGSAEGYTIHTFTDVGTHAFEILDATVSATLTGSGGFTWDTRGTLTLTGANTHTGATWVTDGTLALGNPEAVRHGTLMLVGGAATVTSPGGIEYTLGGLAGMGPFDAKANSLIVGGNGQTTLFSGELTAAGLTKAGLGTLRLSGSNTLESLTISEGVLTLVGAGSIGGDTAIDVRSDATLDLGGASETYELQSGQTLTGSGRILGDLIMGAGSRLEPGGGPGILSYEGDLVFDGAELLVSVFGDGGAGDGHDMLRFVSGDLALRGTPRITVELDGFTPEPGGSYTIISGFANEVADGFDPTVFVRGAGEGFGDGFFRVDYTEGTVALTFVSGSPGLEGDLDADGFVGSADLDIVRAHWGQTVEAGCLSCGDPSGDGLVGSADLDIIRANWGAGAQAAVPEPTFGVLTALGMLLIGLRRRKSRPRF